MKQSPNDPKKYKAIILSNGLRVLLVQNLESTQSAAALAVNVGHFSDPENRQGMAHFLEHMLFLGTEKYPDGSEYQQFISQHGGNHNAWTATEHTCFFFDISHQFYDVALDRFSQFFISPLLSKEFVDKERQNIDAEFKLKLKDDIRRLYDVHKETINPKHPFSKFSVGNSHTLADFEGQDLRDEVERFFNRYYRAQYMTLTMEGPQSLTDLEALADRFFTLIKPATTPLPIIEEPLYHPENLGILINVDPVKDDKQLILSFAMPSIDTYYHEKPESVLAYLLGHEGVGSLLSYLKSKQWVMGISAGSGINGSNFKDFNISLSLTDKGELHRDNIVSIAFSYINLIKSSPLPKFYYQEKQALSSLSFHYHEKLKPLDSVSQLVLNMQHYEEEDYIFGDYVMAGFCQKSIDSLLKYLCPNNLRLLHISQNSYFDKMSKWYEVPYSKNHIPQEKIEDWHNAQLLPQLHLPQANPYIVENPEVLPTTLHAQGKIPKVIDKDDGLLVWFKQDTVFNVPKGYIYIAIDSPLSLISNKNIAMTKLLVALYSDAVIEEHYNAELAGIHYHLYAHQGGVTLQISGISTNQSKLLECLLHSLYNTTYSKDKVELFKSQLITQWENSDSSKSISQLFSLLSSTMQPKNPKSKLLSQALSKVTFTEFMAFCQDVFKTISVEVLIHGNWNNEHAKKITKTIKSNFSPYYDSKHEVTPAMLDIKDKGEFKLSIEIPNHDNAAVLYYPQPEKTLEYNALTMLTSQLLSPAFFQEMRTEKQYGYLVGVGFVPINRYPGLAFYIQSPHVAPQDLVAAMDDFIARSLGLIEGITELHWDNLQQGLIGQLQEKDASLRIKSQRFWSSINNKEMGFDQRKKLIEIVANISLSDICSFINITLKNQKTKDRVVLLSYDNFNDGTPHCSLNNQSLASSEIKHIFPLKH